MANRIANNKVGYEPIPGYVLRKRLGAGGYGEVWLADAPGGLQKAIKLIYGTVDESHATSELRSLQRIRQVYHPFLLSIERIEVVSNQVVIITELAESSLLDRFEQFRRKGSPGIPRASLLDYMRDTADALDFLAQKHALQHLDVKPGNLLIIADRIKVADFGLIKDLHDQNQSLVSGLTPTYSAPEIFDGRPDYRSDQYSLAIVYMEMLTSQLPFEGRTTGELARQHINQAPNLEALPPADRPVVARALSKNPLDRFATCRQFVEQLLKTRSAIVPAQSNSRAPSKTDVDSNQSSTCETVQAQALSGKHEFRKAISTDEIASTWLNPRAMFIGLGGVGGKALVSLRNAVNQDCDCRFGVDDLGWLAIDTDPNALNQLTDEEHEGNLPGARAIQLPIYRPSEYRNAEPELFGPLSRRWLYNIPRSLETEGVRPLAILALLDHYNQLKMRITNDLRDLVEQHKLDEDCQEPLRIYVMSSLHGGTGSGLLAEIGLLVRRVMSDLQFSNYRISAAVTAATTINSHTANLPSAAAIACLSELSYLMNPNYEAPGIYFADNADGTSNARPFDWVTFVDGGMYGNTGELRATLVTLAKAVWLDSQTMSGAVLGESRASCSNTSHGWLRTVTTKPIQISSNISPQNLARWCCEQTLHHALQYMNGPRGVATSSTAMFDAKIDGMPTVSGDMPLTDQACAEFTKRLLTELGVVNSSTMSMDTAIGESGKLCDAQLAQWARRLSNREELISAQLAADILTWRKSIAKTVQMRVYNWKQLEQIQLSVIEGVLDYSENETVELIKLFEPFAELLGTPEGMLKSAADYLRRFSEECVKLLDHFQREGKELSKRIHSWCDSISAEKVLNEASWEVNLSGLPPRLQLLASRVNAVLESTVHRLSLQIVGDTKESGAMPNVSRENHDSAQNVNLNYMLSLSSDLVSRMSGEIGISEADFMGAGENNEGVSLREIASFHPALSESGGQLTRIVVAPAEQQAMVRSTLEKRNLAANTTIVTSTRSLGSHVLCDAVGMQLRQVISSLWRPSPTTLQLSERLRTRCDIDWEPATMLLDCVDVGPADAATETNTTSNPVSMPMVTGTMQIPMDT